MDCLSRLDVDLRTIIAQSDAPLTAEAVAERAWSWYADGAENVIVRTAALQVFTQHAERIIAERSTK